MIELMLNAGQDVTDFLERMTGGPLDDAEAGDELSNTAFFAMANSSQVSVEIGQRSIR